MTMDTLWFHDDRMKEFNIGAFSGEFEQVTALAKFTHITAKDYFGIVHHLDGQRVDLFVSHDAVEVGFVYDKMISAIENSLPVFSLSEAIAEYRRVEAK